ncbi:MAG: hypothetical protein ABIH83_05030 [Candidatus Micrarchaeota archaeon]
MLLFQIFAKKQDDDAEYMKQYTGYISQFKPMSAGEIFASILSQKPDIIIFGETHTLELHRKIISEHLGQFKKEGFGCIALEYFSTDMQEMLDRAKETGDYAEVENHIKRYWDYDLGKAGQSILEMVKSAHRQGFDVLAIDASEEEIVEELGEMPAEVGLERMKYDGKVGRFREEKMAEALSRYKESGVIVLAGAGHTVEIKQNIGKNANVKTAFLIGGEKGGTNFFERAARDAEKENEWLLIEKRKGAPPEYNWEIDYTIHIPQTEGKSAERQKLEKMGNIRKAMRKEHELEKE